MMPSNTSESLSYQEYEQMTKDIEHTTQETKNDLDMAVENITSHYKIAEIPLNEEENQMSDITADLYTVQLFDNSGYRARIRNHGHSCFLCEIVIRSQFHTTYEPEA
jgi:hypothetical protein